MNYSNDESFAYELDVNDKLSSFRKQFYFPKTKNKNNVIYFCGNSLGLQTKKSKDYTLEEFDNWRLKAVSGHKEGARPWFSYHELLTKLTSNIVGAYPSEVVIMNSLTVNIHLLMVSFYRPNNKRYKILIEENAFPSDRYALESQIRFHGYDPEDALITVPSKKSNGYIKTSDVLETINRENSNIALIFFGGVNYYTGQVFDMQSITEAGHKNGSIVGFDLAHGAGNISLALHDWNVDFASWCGYKYLNGGPGAPAGVFIHSMHLEDNNIHRFEGWWGHEKHTRFEMPNKFIPIKTAEAWQLSNPPIFSMASLLASLELFNEAGIENLHKKRNKIISYFDFLLEEELGDNIDIITPKILIERGCQFSFKFENNGKKIFTSLNEANIIADWREPDVIRIAPVPFYNSFHDIWKFVNYFKTII